MKIQTLALVAAIALSPMGSGSPVIAATAQQVAIPVDHAVGAHPGSPRPAGIDKCAYILVADGFVCTVDEFGNVIIKEAIDVINLDKLMDELCKAGVGPGCYVKLKERDYWLDFGRSWFNIERGTVE